jgi:AcrR family transcriptional regulator
VGVGLRELKKEQTRQLIADTAWRLFSDRGFDQVTVAEVAREAQVAEATVFNYFATKEDLFYWRLEAFGTRLVDAVSTRALGESAVTAFRRALTTGGGLLDAADAGAPEAVFRLHVVNTMIASSPALLAREQQAINRTANALAAVLAAEGADDLDAHVVANALLGVHRALLDYVRRRATDAQDLPRLAADVRSRAAAAFELLERGLGGYAVRA